MQRPSLEREPMKFYPIADNLSAEDRQKTGFKGATNLFSLGWSTDRLKAVATGEKRCPKAGEWYLSGAIVEAYRARADLSTPYHIAKLVKVERVETFRVVG